jgi:hypothetical protein
MTSNVHADSPNTSQKPGPGQAEQDTLFIRSATAPPIECFNPVFSLRKVILRFNFVYFSNYRSESRLVAGPLHGERQGREKKRSSRPGAAGLHSISLICV